MACLYPIMAGILFPGATPVVPVDTMQPTETPAAVATEDALGLQAAEPEPAAPFSAAKVVDDAELATVAGMADIKVVQQTVNTQNTGTVSGNTITGNFSTGLVGIDGGAFDGFAGLALFNINTGNNVAINASMSVNVSFQQ